ncbi:MAG TPA: class I SAM-dependent methyltransferase [Hyphomonadaceae bacterium]|nr:class I SAM-dependent methyltransferase [Hyphomonadaceae bacterium]HPN04734.1 class I SAM-dependent methyltransferase [Hyphomonadaceae bacterium]
MASIHSSPGGTKFGEDPELYDFARPPYPSALFDWLRGRAGLTADSVCFEIGAGTGHATLPILDTPVRHIVAIEPDARLAAKLREKAGDEARLAIDVAKFEAAELEADRYDFGFAAMSMHWLPRMKALTKVRNALKSGGHFAMWWNVYHNSAEPDAFGRATEHLFNGIEQDPNATSGRAAFALDIAARLGELRNAGFKDAEHALFEQQVTFTPESLSALYGTFSRVRMAPEETRARLLSEAERIVRDEFGGRVTRTVACSAFVGRRP